MQSLFLLLLFSFVTSLLLTRLVRDLALRLHVLDMPDGGRKRHSQPIPRLGGVAVIASYGVSVLLFVISPLRGAEVLQEHVLFVWLLSPALITVFSIGIADDLIRLTPWQKVAGELAAASYVYWIGIRVSAVGPIQTPDWWSLPVTLAWLVVCTNAFNLIDGMDGLAAGVGIVTAVTVLFAAILQGNFTLALIVAPLIGSLFGFLRYNATPASIFLGDSGSLLIGFLLGCCALIWSQKAATFLGFAAPFIALAFPLLDTALAVARRFLSLRPIFGADHGHIHHRLLDLGNSPRRVILLLYIACAFTAVLSLLQSVLHAQMAIVSVAVFCIGAALCVRKLHYVEFEMASRLVFQGAFRKLLISNVAVEEFERAVMGSNTVDECWIALRNACRYFGFVHVRMCVSPAMYEDWMQDVKPNECWAMKIPLSGYGYISLTRPLGLNQQPLVVSGFITSAHNILESKLPQIQAAGSSSGANQTAQQAGAMHATAASGPSIGGGIIAWSAAAGYGPNAKQSAAVADSGTGSQNGPVV